MRAVILALALLVAGAALANEVIIIIGDPPASAGVACLLDTCQLDTGELQ